MALQQMQVLVNGVNLPELFGLPMQDAIASLGNSFIPTVYLIVNVGTLKYGSGLISLISTFQPSTDFFLAAIQDFMV